jgi:hypothetical protein
MSGKERRMVRKPATKQPHLKKKLEKQRSKSQGRKKK